MSKVPKDSLQIGSGLESFHAFLYHLLILCDFKSFKLGLKPLPLAYSLLCHPSHILQILLLSTSSVLLISFELHVRRNASLHDILSPPLNGYSLQLYYPTRHYSDLWTNEPPHGPESPGKKLSVVMFRCPDQHLCEPPVTL
jgi:hypothetical protein